MARKRKLDVGHRVGKWTILEYPCKSKKVLVKCDCGFTAWRHVANFYAGKTSSCRQCLKGDPVLQTFCAIRNHALRRGREWGLEFNDWVKISSQDCRYCGQAPSNVLAVYGHTYSGIDRVDSSKGYHIENCVPCCKICNRAKSDMGKDDFYSWVRRVYERSEQVV